MMKDDLYLNNITTLPAGVTLSAGGSLDLRSLTTLPADVRLSAGSFLDLRSLTTLPEGVTLSAGGSLDLRSLTTLPEGITLSAGGDLYLWSLTTLPEGVTLNAEGCIRLWNLTVLSKGVTLNTGDFLDLRSLTTLPEGVTLSAEGYYLPLRPVQVSDLQNASTEMAECERIFATADPQIGDWCTWLHHEIQFEKLRQPWRERVAYIRDEKPKDEQALRFRKMRPLPKGVDILKLIRETIQGESNAGKETH